MLKNGWSQIKLYFMIVCPLEPRGFDSIADLPISLNLDEIKDNGARGPQQGNH